jgi:microsomal dipeptidase-like Zn-dependent dipeptidase
VVAICSFFGTKPKVPSKITGLYSTTQLMNLFNVPSLVWGLEDVSKYIDLFAHLAGDEENPWTEIELEMLAGNNFLRVFTAVEQVNKCKLPNICRQYNILPAYNTHM